MAEFTLGKENNSMTDRSIDDLKDRIGNMISSLKEEEIVKS